MPGAATAKALSPKGFAVLKTEVRKKSSLSICEKKRRKQSELWLTHSIARDVKGKKMSRLTTLLHIDRNWNVVFVVQKSLSLRQWTN